MSIIHNIVTTVAPSAAPDRVGQHWTNTTSGISYISVGTSGVGDWKDVTTPGGGGTSWTKYTLSHAAFQTAALTNNVALITLAAKASVDSILIKTTTAFSGGAISAYNLTVGITGTESKYLTSYSAFAAVAGSNYNVASINTLGADFNATESIKIFATSVGANLNASTAGSVDVYVRTSQLP